MQHFANVSNVLAYIKLITKDIVALALVVLVVVPQVTIRELKTSVAYIFFFVSGPDLFGPLSLYLGKMLQLLTNLLVLASMNRLGEILPLW